VIIPAMALPTEPVTLSVEQINELNRKLSELRHDVNNHASLIMASVELIRRRPESAERMLNMIVEQPHKISESITQFSGDMESALRITQP
jgi:methyl-accepting chemotaxis protein